MIAPPLLNWRMRDRVIETGSRTLVMGILNVTPDSFSDGARHGDAETAVAYGVQMRTEGADILDVGGESSRPGAEPVSESVEMTRVIPVVRELARRTDAVISVDTTKAAVARAALEAGAHIINDISAMTFDPSMAAVARDYGAGVVLMHMQGTPRTMQDHPRYDDVVAEVSGYLADRVAALVSAGLNPETIVVDPGIGFGKTDAHNLALLGGIPAIAATTERPVLIGLSRKGFLGRMTGLPVAERLAPSLAGLTYAILKGARIVRVHDVKESCAAARVADTLRAEQAG